MGGFWYFYPQQIEGPPDYVSDVEVADDATAAPSPAAPTEETNYAVYYRPGDLTGTRYQTLEECLQPGNRLGTSANASRTDRDPSRLINRRKVKRPPSLDGLRDSKSPIPP